MAQTYGDFKALVQKYLIDSTPQLEAVIPEFVSFAQDEVSRLVKFPFDEGSFDYTATVGNDVITFPTDLMSLKVVTVNGKHAERLDREAFLKLSPDNCRTVFTQYNNTLVFSPALEVDDKVSIVYHKDFPRFVSDTDTNVALEKARDLLLFLSLRHAGVYLRDTDMIEFWNQKATEAADTLSQQFDDAYWAGSSLSIQGIRRFR